MKQRVLTPEEQKLWEQVTRGDARMISRQLPVSGGALMEKQKIIRRNEPAPFAPLPSLPERRAGLDWNTAARLRKGKIAIDAALDLHGMTREKAHRALAAFIQWNYGQGHRCLLVITGKGGAERRSVLREALPQWLDAPDLRPVILAVEAARQQHGGAGAYYVMLRKKRG